MLSGLNFLVVIKRCFLLLSLLFWIIVHHFHETLTAIVSFIIKFLGKEGITQFLLHVCETLTGLVVDISFDEVINLCIMNGFAVDLTFCL